MHARVPALHSLTVTAAAAALSSLLIGCGGGGSSTTTDSNAYLSGTAAYGAPLSSASVTVTDTTGKTTTVTAGTDGSYTATVTGFTAPLLVTASGNSGDGVRTYRALVGSGVAPSSRLTANVTPLTEAITALASSDGASPEEFADTAKLKNLDPAKLKKAQDAVVAVVKDIATDLGDADFDPLATPFKADRTSAGDKLLDIVKVSIRSDTGVSLRNAFVPASTSDLGAPSTAMVTLKDANATATPLPKAAVAENSTIFDAWVAQVNKCLALPQTSRVSVDGQGKPTAFLGDCAAITNFATNYKRNGYTLLQYWGDQLRNWAPNGAVLGTPEVLGFVQNSSAEDLAIVRLPYTSPKGGGSYIEVARKVAGSWLIEGNQRNYDAGVSVRMYRISDASTYGFVPPFGPDAGKNVGKVNYYAARLVFGFNQSGPNGSNVFAVRIKGPGLPASGIVLARSSACGTGDYLASFNGSSGGVPAAPAIGSTFPLPSTSTANSYTLYLTPNGTYNGSDLYNDVRGRNADGTPIATTLSTTAPKPGVDISTIPELAAYKFDVFKAGSNAVADTFTVRVTTRPISAKDADKLGWANFDAASLKYVDPAHATTAGELTTATLGWAVPAGGAPSTSAYLRGTGFDTSTPPVFRQMLMATPLQALGDTSLTLNAAPELDGNGNTCTYARVPTFSASSGSREIGTRQTRVDGLVMQQVVLHLPRPAN